MLSKRMCAKKVVFSRVRAAIPRLLTYSQCLKRSLQIAAALTLQHASSLWPDLRSAPCRPGRTTMARPVETLGCGLTTDMWNSGRSLFSTLRVVRLGPAVLGAGCIVSESNRSVTQVRSCVQECICFRCVFNVSICFHAEALNSNPTRMVAHSLHYPLLQKSYYTSHYNLSMCWKVRGRGGGQGGAKGQEQKTQPKANLRITLVSSLYTLHGLCLDLER